jgi:deoxyribodipyrimidine photo-lyase
VRGAVAIVWHRQDLRVADNPALRAARDHGAVVPVYIWSPHEEGAWAPGGASRWWLHRSLRALHEDLASRGSRLILRRGDALSALRALIAETGATAVFWNRRYEPAIVARDRAVKAALRADGVAAESFNASLLFEPWAIATKTGGPFQVFTPFWNACRAAPPPPPPLPAPKAIAAPPSWPAGEALGDLALEPEIDWAGGLRDAWEVGAAAAERRLARFVQRGLASYAARRDEIDEDATSRLSPHVHFGEIGPRQIWSKVADADRSDRFATEIGWREFAHHLLFHFPQTAERPLRAAFDRFPWRRAPAALRAWQRGRTGYPIVDAAMRCLWTTGWMPNRARMIVASFLTKHLLLPWQEGAAWFWDTLVDADLASNTLGWQWAAGCGADAAPYFRIFNPTLQGEKFDAEGAFVRRWVPELAGLPAKWIHRPSSAPASVLAAAGVSPGREYPRPIVDHAESRERALAAFASIRAR